MTTTDRNTTGFINQAFSSAYDRVKQERESTRTRQMDGASDVDKVLVARGLAIPQTTKPSVVSTLDTMMEFYHDIYNAANNKGMSPAYGESSAAAPRFKSTPKMGVSASDTSPSAKKMADAGLTKVTPRPKAPRKPRQKVSP